VGGRLACAQLGHQPRPWDAFALAEREATDWQAAQEAHVFERQFRLGQTSTMALDMLREIRGIRWSAH
jgi:hypothetical protein